VRPFLDDGDLQLWHGDALTVLRGLPDGSVDCCVTSPPYSDARRDIEAVPPDEFPAWLAGSLRPLQRLLTTSGTLMLNLGRRFRDGEELSLAEDSLQALRADGWRRIDTLIWFKPNANGRGGPYLRDCHEVVYWLALSPRDAFRNLDEVRRPYRDLSRYERGYTQAVKGEPRALHRRQPHPLGARPDSVFVCSVGKEKGREHPTPMPLELAQELVALACPPGGTVVDPFFGEGTTGRAARILNRRCIGVEISLDYCALAARRTQQLSLTAGAVS
jgi:site-specific DNA-methyltransferase (adenine-specific)